MGALSALGGGGASANSSASTGPARSGDVGGSQYSFGGINTGTQSTVPPWVTPVIIGVGLLAAFYLFRKR